MNISQHEGQSGLYHIDGDVTEKQAIQIKDILENKPPLFLGKQLSREAANLVYQFLTNQNDYADNILALGVQIATAERALDFYTVKVTSVPAYEWEEQFILALDKCMSLWDTYYQYTGQK